MIHTYLLTFLLYILVYMFRNIFCDDFDIYIYMFTDLFTDELKPIKINHPM